jgi:hypothetical protein
LTLCVSLVSVGCSVVFLYVVYGELMPPLPNVSKVVRVDWKLTLANGVAAQWRKYFQYAGTLSAGDAQATAFKADLVNTVTVDTIQLTDLTSSSSPQVQGVGSTAGTSGGTQVNNGAAFVVRDKISRRYRGGHPRTYLCGMATTRQNGPDTWDPTNGTNFLNDWVTYVNACIAAVPGAAAPALEVSVSYFAGFTNRTFPSGRVHPVPTPRGVPIIDAIIGHTFNPRIASQRRRNR